MVENGKPKSKFALVMVTDIAYLRGANAIINAMDYYGNKMDLIVIHDLLPEGYIESVLAADLDYRVVFIPYDDIKDSFYDSCPGLLKNRFNYSCYVRHWFMDQIKDKYSVVGLIESDAMLLENIEPWFEFAQGTDKLLTAYHLYHNFALENYTPEMFEFAQPLYVHPLICDPKKWSDMFQMMLKIASEKPETIDMKAMNMAVCLCGKKDKVVVLPDPEWLGGWIYTNPVLQFKLLNEKRYLLAFPSMTRIKMLHGKYYSDGFRFNICSGASPEHKPVMKRNLEVIYEFFRFFNDDLKVKLPVLARFDMDRSLL